MCNIVLITAKGGNQSIKNKNLIKLKGKTFLNYQIECAQNAELIDYVFVSTECPLIKKEAEKCGAIVIDRPKNLAESFTNHGDAIMHGAKEARKFLQKNIETVTILLGNTVMNRPDDIDETITAVKSNTDADSAMTVWKAQDDHPYRALKIGENGYLESFLDIKSIDTNRQSYPEVYFYDQGPWTVRYSSLLKSEKEKYGPACWWWMGKKSIPIIRNWVTGKDVHTMLDVEISKAWIENHLWRF